jgi:phosphoadenosine phosphosulfate reductase
VNSPSSPGLDTQSLAGADALDPSHLGERITRIRAELAAFKADGKRVFATSSFQSNSVVLLHLLARLEPEVPVFFLQTGFHFPETLRFRRSLASRFGLDVRDVRSPISRHQQVGQSGRLLFAEEPDRCCHVNKVTPLEPVLAAHDVWVSGVRATQSSTRAAMGRTAPGRGGVMRFHPIIDWNARDVYQYVQAHDLPSHPLEEEGFLSVGCAPCTRRPMDEPDLGGPELPVDGERAGRWAGMQKTECGLHLTGDGDSA